MKVSKLTHSQPSSPQSGTTYKRPNHIGLLENNNHVDPREGGWLTGVVDRHVGSFAISIADVENLPSIARTAFSHGYHANYREICGVSRPSCVAV